MTHEQFLQWLDGRIDYNKKEAERKNRQRQPYHEYLGRAAAYEAVKEKFLTLLPPPQKLN